jgi:hypothetical protein
MAPQDTQGQALTIEQYRRLIHEIYKIILADSGMAGVPPPAQEMALDAEAPEAPAEMTADGNGQMVDEASTRPKRHAA